MPSPAAPYLWTTFARRHHVPPMLKSSLATALALFAAALSAALPAAELPHDDPAERAALPERRGLLYWPGDAETPARLLFPGGKKVIALDPKTGQRIASFGDNGSVPIPTGGSAGGAVYKRVLVMPGFDRDVYGFDVVSG